MLLSVNNLEVCYGVISALQDVSLSIDRNEIVTLIGANGAGKTTLLRTISGLLRPARGSITWNPPPEAGAGVSGNGNGGGVPIHGLAPHAVVRHGIGHVPEGRRVFANLSVRENLMLGAYQR